jgi:hypothetical protein
MHLGIPPWAKRFSNLAKSPLQAALQAAGSQGEDTAGFEFYPVLKRPYPNDSDMQQGFHDQATDWCQWAQDLTPRVVSEGRNRIFRALCHCQKHIGPRGTESWWVPAEPRIWTHLLKKLSPGQAQPHSCTATTAGLLRQLLVWTWLYPWFVSHFQSYSNQHSPLTDSNAWADNLVSGLALGLLTQTATPVEPAQLKSCSVPSKCFSLHG